MKQLGLFKTNKFGIIIATIFFLLGLLTLSDYGINTDEPAHFIRGQAYLKILTTSELHYSEYELTSPRASNWIFKEYDPAYYLNTDSGHPALNDILAAATNKIFYTFLGILGDLQAYHLFEIFVSGIGIFFLYLLIKQHSGEFAGCIAAISFALYPLFLGESHFNIKDPVLTSFFIITIYFFYQAVNKMSAKLFLVSTFFCALAFGTKFNIIFLPFIIFPYLLIRFFPILRKKGFGAIKEIPISIIICLIVCPLIIIAIHLLTRPYLWADPVNRFIEIVKYYKDIGTGVFPDSRFLFRDWNTYPAFFIAVSTPPIIIFLSIVGVLFSIFNFKRDKNKVTLLLFLWMVIPILRVSIPGSSIYNGVRQIMEFIPAMAAFCGIGAFYLHRLISRYISSKFAYVLILLSFIPLMVTLIRIHPNESMYMNFMIGGLKGAYDHQLPGAGESMGNVYLQGVKWLNQNAEQDAKFGLPVGLFSNIPQDFIREDIAFGPYFSGMKQDGEYMIEKISIGFPPQHILNYNIRYLEAFLTPIHVIKVDGATVLKIWKNDKNYLKKGFRNEKEITNFVVSKDTAQGFVEIGFQNPEPVVRIEIDHEDKNCASRLYEYQVTPGHVSFSTDGQQEIIFGNMELAQGPYAMTLQDYSRFVYFMLGEKVKWIRIVPVSKNSCILKINQIKLFARDTDS